MDDKLFGVLSTTTGLIIGWTLNEFSFFLKTNKENKRSLNQILFFQLEIRDVIKKTNFEDLENSVEEIIRKRFPNDDDNAFQNTVGKVMKGFIQHELNTKFLYKIKALTNDYSTCINSLAKISPLITFKISNKEIILDYLGYINSYLDAVKNYLDKPVISNEKKVEPDKTFKILYEEIQDKITPLIRETALETIETDIKIVSKKIGFIKHSQIKKFLRLSKQTQFDSIDIKKIEYYLDSFNIPSSA